MLPHDEAAFLTTVAPLRPAIRLHCYRMLGSSHDGDDMVQETFLRAWRARDSLKDPAQLKSWLYRIATNACFDELKRRPRRHYPTDAFPSVDTPRPPLPRIEEPVWLEPMPNSWLEGVDEREPEARYALKESVALAFVAALHCLTPVQRAALLLRDVVGLSASETASLLNANVEAANSALFRARAAIEKRLGGAGPEAIAAHTEVDPHVLHQYVRAFEDANLDAIVALFHEDMRTTMPPAPTWVAGRDANERFYRTMFATLLPGQFRHLPIGANGQPALAFYRPQSPGAKHTLSAIQLLTTRARSVITVDHVMLTEVYDLFDVPREFPG